MVKGTGVPSYGFVRRWQAPIPDPVFVTSYAELIVFYIFHGYVPSFMSTHPSLVSPASSDWGTSWGGPPFPGL